MGEKYELESYSKLAEAADFYLFESFKYLDIALTNESANIIYAEKLKKIELTDKDREITEKTVLPTETIEFLRSSNFDVISDETVGILSNAWHESIIEAKRICFKFQKNTKIDSIELLGAINSLAFFIETIVNRHLLFLRDVQEIQGFIYN